MRGWANGRLLLFIATESRATCHAPDP
jgi:hypothetical protein